MPPTILTDRIGTARAKCQISSNALSEKNPDDN